MMPLSTAILPIQKAKDHTRPRESIAHIHPNLLVRGGHRAGTQGDDSRVRAERGATAGGIGEKAASDSCAQWLMR